MQTCDAESSCHHSVQDNVRPQQFAVYKRKDQNTWHHSFTSSFVLMLNPVSDFALAKNVWEKGAEGNIWA
jgi:hypothetical protein